MERRRASNQSSRSNLRRVIYNNGFNTIYPHLSIRYPASANRRKSGRSLYPAIGAKIHRRRHNSPAVGYNDLQSQLYDFVRRSKSWRSPVITNQIIAQYICSNSLGKKTIGSCCPSRPPKTFPPCLILDVGRPLVRQRTCTCPVGGP